MHFRTDIALEHCEYLRQRSQDTLAGVDIRTETDEANGITTTWVEIINDAGAAHIGKPVGNYITLECEAMKAAEPEIHEEISRLLAWKMGALFPLPDEATILVVGLGNWLVTPDALGPQVCEKMLVTRHLAADMPDELVGRVRNVCALRPGVMGLTGIETAEIVLGVADRVKPDLIVAVDALAARSTARINSTIQLTDTGINPGAGLGNKRTPINNESVGVPVIGLGVPTVVSAATLVHDTMDGYADDETIGAHIAAHAANFFVTPKDVDAVVMRLARIIANALNMALHPGISAEDVNRYLG
ncbi:MAG: GPR endopeptidase [Defluviitaleaceae bacterium]|nr:GPR endopeptidase [Defluviitaleaceae bacterium]